MIVPQRLLHKMPLPQSQQSTLSEASSQLAPLFGWVKWFSCKLWNGKCFGELIRLDFGLWVGRIYKGWGAHIKGKKIRSKRGAVGLYGSPTSPTLYNNFFGEQPKNKKLRLMCLFLPCGPLLRSHQRISSAYINFWYPKTLFMYMYAYAPTFFWKFLFERCPLQELSIPFK